MYAKKTVTNLLFVALSLSIAITPVMADEYVFDSTAEFFDLINDGTIEFYDNNEVSLGFSANGVSDLVAESWHKTLLSAQAMGKTVLITHNGGVITKMRNPGSIAVNLSNGLVLHLSMDGNVTDDSSSGLNGTATDITYVTDQNGNANGAAYFNGTSSKVIIPHSSTVDISSVYTVALKIRADSVSDRHGRFINKGIKATSFWGIMHTMNGTFRLQNYANDAWQPVTLSDPTSVVVNRWYDVAITSDGTTASMYIDGSLSGTSTANWDVGLPQNTSNIWLGACEQYPTPNNVANTFKGAIGDLKMYNRALTSTEISLLAQ